MDSVRERLPGLYDTAGTMINALRSKRRSVLGLADALEQGGAIGDIVARLRVLAAEDDLGGPSTAEYDTVERCSGYSTRMLLLTNWMGQELRAFMDPQRPKDCVALWYHNCPDEVYNFMKHLMNNLSVDEVTELLGNEAKLQEAVAHFNAKSSKKNKKRCKKGASSARS